MNDSRKLNFEKCAVVSGLLTVQQLDEARLALRNGNPETTVELTDQELADKVVALGLLNPWQAKQLLDGKVRFTLGPYRIVDSLGQGGMGHVYKAEDPVLKRTVAIKVLPREKSTPEAIANFTREIQALSSLNHPRLVRAVDAGYDGNVNYLVTEFVPGCDLRKLVRRGGPLTMEAASNIIAQVAEGLHHAHQQGIVHRDVKPGNVLVTPEGDAKLSDLGLAGPMYANAEQDPRHGKIVGTADYLSPDHIDSPWNPVPAWDVYSLGCTLYYAVTGKVPFPGGTTSEKARAHRSMKPLDPRRLNGQLIDAFVDVLADMMAKDPAQRTSSAVEVVERLTPWSRQFQNQRMANPSSVSVFVGTAGADRSATTASSLSVTPLEPLSLMVPPPFPPVPPEEHRFGAPVIPPPVIAQPAASWDLDSSPAGDAPILAADSLLRDTLPDQPLSAEGGSESELSISLAVEPPKRIPLRILLGLAVAPILLTGAVLLIAWMTGVRFE